MTKWRKRLADDYSVSIAYGKNGQAKATIPAPLIETFDRPARLRFILAGREITVKFEKAESTGTGNFENKSAN